MRKTLFVTMLLSAVLAFGQASPNEPKPVLAKDKDKAPQYVLTDLQKAKLDAARRDIWHWQDNLNRSINEFVGLCQEAAKENKWPTVACNWNDLSVVTGPPQPVPAGNPASSPAQPPPPAKP